MTDSLLILLAEHGPAIVWLTTLLACLAVPIPASLVMLAAGGFAAAGDMSLLPVLLAALAGAVMGDHLGYAIGRWGGAGLWARLEARPSTAQLLLHARGRLQANGGRTVFLSRWLFSPLGPYVNVVAGAAGLGLRRFTLACLLGEMVWVSGYTGLGYGFSSQIDRIEALAGEIGFASAAGVLALVLGRMLWRGGKAATRGGPA